ncbi:MAG: ABC transporter ATP-binding protein [Lentihominibacter sp.]|jgi:ATP-binding cassette subfamily B multidrug efflux pump
MAEKRREPEKGSHGAKMMPGEKPKNFKETILTLAGYLIPYKWQLVIVAVAALVSTIFNIVSPAVLGMATDKVIQGLTGSGIDYRALLIILMILLGMYLLSWGFGVLQNWLMSVVSQKVIYTLRDEFSKKLDRLPLKYFDKVSYGEVQSRMINDIETINQTLTATITHMITSVIIIVGIAIMMISISILMAAAALTVIPLSIFIIKIMVKKSQGHFMNQQKYLGQVNGHVEEMYSGHEIIKVFNREEISEKTFKEYNDGLYEAAWKSQFISGLMPPLTQLVGNLSYVMVCFLGGYLALKGKISIGQIQAFIQYVRSFDHPIHEVANIVNQLQSTAAAAERIFEILDEEEEEGIDEEPAFALDVNKIRGEVVFENVRFGYNDDEIVINNFSFKASAGRRIAIVGPTGAGKTTIVKLLMRYYELNDGVIYVDGCNIRDLSRSNLRELFGMVLQDTWLNSGTIRENIRYGCMDATDEEVEEAARAAYADHFIRTLPDGYEMKINEDASNISAGQKQLLTIARAFLADAPILILDEATSSVDTRTEYQIQQAMDELMCDRTSFIIAHRLSTIKDADCILVMDHGDIVEQGSHEELLARGGFYAELYNSQFAHQL